jgi:spermidine/putrescine transport system permease protein
MKRRIGIGPLVMLPVGLLLLAGFVVPIAIVAIYSFMPPRTFALTTNLTVANYETAVMEGYWRPLMWSTLGALTTTLAPVRHVAVPDARWRHTGRQH